MPTYKYQCPKCSQIEVAVRQINDKDVAPQCPICDIQMIRQYGIQTIRFIGGGWGKDA